MAVISPLLWTNTLLISHTWPLFFWIGLCLHLLNILFWIGTDTLSQIELGRDLKRIVFRKAITLAMGILWPMPFLFLWLYLE